MGDLLIRDVPELDVETLRAAASSAEQSLQRYLVEALRAHATFVRRQLTIDAIAQNLDHRTALSEADLRDAGDALTADLERSASER